MTARARDAAARREIVASWPDRMDPDSWPDMNGLPGRMLPLVEMLESEVIVMRRRGLPTEQMEALRDIARKAREALIVVGLLSALEEWRLLHPARPDPLDGVTDCGGGDCPRVGFRDRADRDLHYRRWGLT